MFHSQMQNCRHYDSAPLSLKENNKIIIYMAVILNFVHILSELRIHIISQDPSSA